MTEDGPHSGTPQSGGPAAGLREARGRYTWDVLLRVLRRMSFSKSAYASMRARGLVIVGRRTKLVLRAGGRIVVRPGAALIIGIEPHRPLRSLLEVHRGGELVADGLVLLGRGTSVVVGDGGRLTLGGGTYLNESCRVFCYAHSSIGQGCAIGWGTTLIDTDVHTLVRSNVESPLTAPFTVADHVWIGADVSILKGVSIGAGAVIGARSLVISDVPAACLAVGHPARVVTTDVAWRP